MAISWHPSSAMFKAITRVVIVLFILQTLSPMFVLALTQGPLQPEFAEFEPVGSSNLVNPFTGDFTYNLPVINIPGPNGMGYALSLSYHSGASVEDEASWVGHGWTLNAGAINRIKRGFPDDHRKSSVTYWNDVRSNWTATVSKRLGLEFFSKEESEGSGDRDEPRVGWPAINGMLTHRYNNHRGYGYTWGVNAGSKGLATLGYSSTDGRGHWNYMINPMEIFLKYNEEAREDLSFDKENSWYERVSRDRARKFARNGYAQTPSSTGLFGMWNFNDYGVATSVAEYDGFSWDFTAAVEGDLSFLPVGIEGGMAGSYTSQSPKKKKVRNAYGYMYSGDTDISDDDMMDYYLEKESYFQKRDLFMSIPFSNADIFSVSGEGVGGSFKLHHKQVGHFRPAKSSSSLEILHGNADIHLGGNVGSGAAIGFGWQSTEVSGWQEWNDGQGYEFPTFEPKSKTLDEPYYFRFIDDMGGSIERDADDDPIKPVINTSFLNAVTGINIYGSGLSYFQNNPSVAHDKSDELNEAGRSGRSAYIGYNTNASMLDRPPFQCYENGKGGVLFRSYTKRQDVANGFVDRSDEKIKDGIGEFAITKEDGTVYVYGLPVYSRNEGNIQYGLAGVNAENVQENFLVYHHEDFNQSDKGDRLRVMGEEQNDPYATTYLLTEIRSPEYIDRTNNGPTPDDVGGYVRFNYKRMAGSWNKSRDDSLDFWYRWRTPYNGNHYKRNEFSDPYDDIGQVSWGYKEIYYLESVETRTHVAEFVTGDRADGYEAVHNEYTAATDDEATTTGGANKLRRLDKIELFSKKANGIKGEILSTVHLKYDDLNPLCPDLPNAASSTGKLTLQKVWFENEGVADAYIHPYEFGYQYRTASDYDLPSDVSSKYASILGYGDSWSPSEQNPQYSAFDIDRWGDYQYDGKSRQSVYNYWVNQNPSVDFDPAAWQLKWIRLPSGGELQVHYEQNQYSYVQDRPAMAMVSIAERDGNRYRLNVESDLGMDSDQIDDLANSIRSLFIGKSEAERKTKDHMYFRFIYSLEGTSSISIHDCEAEKITGYVKVKDVGTETDGGVKYVWVELGDDANEYTLPESVCANYVHANRANIIQHGSCNASLVGIPNFEVEARNDNQDKSNHTSAFHAMMSLLVDFGDYYDDDKNCKIIDEANSYLRVPLPPSKAKLGGGVRVKRLLMYDPGLESDEDAALYGTEYYYENADGTSSGVATNEPVVGREENALVTLIAKREGQNLWEDIFAAEDIDQFEGPLGESIMPAASIGYSRVVAENIHTGKTGTGYSVSEYFTSKDYPFDPVDPDTYTRNNKTDLNGPGDVRYNIYTGVLNYSASYLRRSQGFRFVLNSMHGQPRRMATYAGDYQTGVNPSIPQDEAVYEYFEPGEKIPVLVGKTLQDTIHAYPGKAMEVLAETRKVVDVLDDANVSADFGLGLAGIIPLPYFSLSPELSIEDHNFYTYTTTKVVKYPAVLKRTVSIKEGARNEMEYVAFQRQSGKAAIVRTEDGFDEVEHGVALDIHDGAYYSIGIPAYDIYPAMGQKALTERRFIYGDIQGPLNKMKIDKRYVLQPSGDEEHYLSVTYGAPGSESEILNFLTSGDLIRVFQVDEEGDVTSELGDYHVGNIGGNRIELLPVSFSWRITDFLREYVQIEIIRSARANYLTRTAGEYTIYGEPAPQQEYPAP